MPRSGRIFLARRGSQRHSNVYWRHEMGVQIINMPDIGEGIAEVELVAWHVKVGEMVAEDQILADVMTDKATVEIPSSVAGKVLALGGAVGQVLAVGSELIRIEVEGAGNLKEGSVAPIPEPPAVRHEPVEALRQAQGESKVTLASTAPHARLPGDKPIASPAVRSRAWELGIELQFVPGSGPAGRITQEDLDAYAARAGQKQADGQIDQRYAERHHEEAIPVIGLRRKIAQKMQELSLIHISEPTRQA